MYIVCSSAAAMGGDYVPPRPKAALARSGLSTKLATSGQ